MGKFTLDHEAIEWLDRPFVRLTEHMSESELANEKIRALAAFLNVDEELITMLSDTAYECDDCQFLVVTDSEADDAMEDKIAQDAVDNSAEILKNEGRGYFLAADKEEISESEFFIYRLN